MPTYEYVCNHCKKKIDVFQSIKEKPKRKCPSCGKNGLKRLMGLGSGIIFKGSGFYETDYRSESYKKDKAKDIKSEKPQKKKEETKTTKTAEKS